MAGEIKLDADVLRYHAGRVGQNADDVRLAENAARSLNIGGGAFGLMCSMLVPPAQLVSSAAISAITAAAEMLERTERDLRGLADDAEAIEADNSSTIASISTLMGDVG